MFRVYDQENEVVFYQGDSWARAQAWIWKAIEADRLPKMEVLDSFEFNTIEIKLEG